MTRPLPPARSPEPRSPEPRPARPTRARSTAALAVSVLAATGLVGAAVPASADDPAAPGAEQVVNGSFDDGLVGWTAYPSPSVVDGRGCVDVPAGSGPYSAALTQQVPMEAGETYRLTFEALTEPATAANVRVVVQAGADLNYLPFLPARKLALTPEPTSFAATFTPEQDYAAAELAIQQDIANAEAYRLCVDDVSLTGGAEPEAYVPDTGSRLKVNHLGYLPRGPKAATLVTESTEPVRWELRRADGRRLSRGESTPRGVDPTAGTNVHTIDFSRVPVSGEGFTLVADGATSQPFAIAADLYEPLRTDAKTFFHTNRSGIAISDELVPGYGREAGHVGVAPNQGDAAVPCLPLEDDAQQLYVDQGEEPWTCAGTHDVTGGWYDAGDHGKYVVNGGIAVAQLLQEQERRGSARTADRDVLGDGALRIPEAGNGVPDLLDEVRWELEWMLRMQVPAGEQHAGMAYHKVADADWTGLPLLPADDPQPRHLYRPSTAAALNLAAAAAQGARLWRPYDAAFADELLAAARTAYAAAQAEPHLYAPAPDPAVDPNPGSGPYDDDDVSDEFYWAAAELFLTTGEDAYESDVLASPHHTGDVFGDGAFSWGDVAALGRLDLATVPSDLPDRERVRASVVAGADGYVEAAEGQPFGQTYAPEDGQYAWGSNSAVTNSLQVVGTAYDLTGDARYADAFLGGLDYLFGRNALDRSYVTGYGERDSRNQHSRWYAAQLDPSLPHPPAGTLSGGPNSTAASSGDPVAAPVLGGCAAQLCYLDDIGSWSTNEITINWNAPMSWVASFAADLDRGVQAHGRHGR
ncbi:glycoside hydrolase family 9 protein [Pseudokineococcus marinus]|uniref:Endoglucanase n=1 Tax=Pseudokineococcus marinus TaxID=351215 RepID=A0A849BXX5_9ACTN|nr:glycoside hydrolase family 9 protein [Pseudokineococcus marinus]NNH22378.1 glycosyl hydrolase family 5 [Pseudokineococcus marinus]